MAATTPHQALGRHDAARDVTWIAGAVGTAVIGALITVNTDQVKSWVSARNPVSVEYGAPTEPVGGFNMVAPDGSRLAPEISRTRDDCDQLWDLGIVAALSRRTGSRDR